MSTSDATSGDRQAHPWSLERALSYSLEGRVAIVTGAGGAGGIGETYARALGRMGAAVAAVDVDGDGAERVAETLCREGLRVIGLAADVSDARSVTAMAEKTVAEWGGIDILVNNAALMLQIPNEPLASYPLDWWDRVLRVNVTGALVCAQACIPEMRRRGGGKIVNQVSRGAFVNLGGPYGVSKLALVGLTVGLARELGRDRIMVNAIAPGAIESAVALEKYPIGSPWRERETAQAALDGSAPPDALCGALVFLVSSASDHMTGQCLVVDGGGVMRL